MSDAVDLHKTLASLADELERAQDALGEANAIHADESRKLTAIKGQIEAAEALSEAFSNQLKDQRKARKDASDAAKETAQAAKDARDAFEAAADKQGLSADNVQPLYAAFKAAIAAHDDASDKAASTKAAVELTTEQKKQIEATKANLEQAHDAQAKEEQEAQDERLNGKKEVDRILHEMEKVRDALGKALTAAPSGPAGPSRPTLGGLVKLYQEQGAESIKDFLTIKTRRVDFDDWADHAFVELEKWAAKQVSREAVRSSTLDAGVGSDIDAVTRKLNRRRISDIRREILARTYPLLLRNRLADSKTKSPDDTFQVKVQVAEDHTGLADTIVLDLDAKTAGSPRDVFSKLMTEIAVENLNLDAPAGSPEYEILKAKICAST